jgi:hypothetical protein
MPKRSSKPADPNKAAFAILNETIGVEPAARKKDPAAVSLGRRGGLKGGRARAEALSPEDRKRIAEQAAAARWADRPKKS